VTHEFGHGTVPPRPYLDVGDGARVPLSVADGYVSLGVAVGQSSQTIRLYSSVARLIAEHCPSFTNDDIGAVLRIYEVGHIDNWRPSMVKRARCPEYRRHFQLTRRKRRVEITDELRDAIDGFFVRAALEVGG
jgi:hypothetical protein